MRTYPRHVPPWCMCRMYELFDPNARCGIVNIAWVCSQSFGILWHTHRPSSRHIIMSLCDSRNQTFHTETYPVALPKRHYKQLHDFILNHTKVGYVCAISLLSGLMKTISHSGESRSRSLGRTSDLVLHVHTQLSVPCAHACSNKWLLLFSCLVKPTAASFMLSHKFECAVLMSAQTSGCFPCDRCTLVSAATQAILMRCAQACSDKWLLLCAHV